MATAQIADLSNCSFIRSRAHRPSGRDRAWRIAERGHASNSWVPGENQGTTREDCFRNGQSLRSGAEYNWQNRPSDCTIKQASHSTTTSPHIHLHPSSRRNHTENHLERNQLRPYRPNVRSQNLGEIWRVGHWLRKKRGTITISSLDFNSINDDISDYISDYITDNEILLGPHNRTTKCFKLWKFNFKTRSIASTSPGH